MPTDEGCLTELDMEVSEYDSAHSGHGCARDATAMSSIDASILELSEASPHDRLDFIRFRWPRGLRAQYVYMVLPAGTRLC